VAEEVERRAKEEAEWKAREEAKCKAKEEEAKWKAKEVERERTVEAERKQHEAEKSAEEEKQWQCKAVLQTLALAKRPEVPVALGSGLTPLEMWRLKKQAAAGHIVVSVYFFLLFCLFCFLGFRLGGSGRGGVPKVPERRPHLQAGWARPCLQFLQAAEDHLRSFGPWEEVESHSGGWERHGVAEKAAMGGDAQRETTRSRYRDHGRRVAP
jgi:hypothetical protein